jgi:alkylmercury lyase
MTARSLSLSSLADGLADTFPAADDAPLARALLALLARGEPVIGEQLAAATKRPPAEVNAALASWPNVHRDGRGAVVAFSGLTLRPTEHRFRTGGRELFAWCAWDTLFLPALLEQPADVRSTCPLTATTVRLRLDAAGISGSEPADLGVSFPPVATTSTASIVESFCRHVHFLAGHATARRWLSVHPGGRVLAPGDAYEVGQRATARLRTPITRGPE